MEELLLGFSCAHHEQSICHWNYKTGNDEHVYRSSKCTPVRNSLHQLGNACDYVLIAEEGKPFLHMWPTNSQGESQRISIPGPAKAVCVDASSTYLVLGIGIKTYIWMLSSGELLAVLQQHYQPITSIKVSNTTEHLVVGGEDGILITYNFSGAISSNLLGQCKPLYKKMDHTGAITDICLGNFGRKSRVATISVDYSCRIYNLETGKPLLVLVFPEKLSSIIFDTTSYNIYVGDYAGLIKMVPLQNISTSLSQHVDSTVPSFNEHQNRIICLDINRKNEVLVSASDDCSIIMWCLRTHTRIRKLVQESPVTCLKFVLPHVNIYAKDFKPQIIIKSLGKNINDNIENVELSIVQNSDIVLDEGTEVQTFFSGQNSNKRKDMGSSCSEDVKKLKKLNSELMANIVDLYRRFNK